MIQQLNFKLKCQQDDHKEEVDMVCYNSFCTEFRLNCFKCIKKGIHHSHFDKNKECDNLINTSIESVNHHFLYQKEESEKNHDLMNSTIKFNKKQQYRIKHFLQSEQYFSLYAKDYAYRINNTIKKPIKGMIILQIQTEFI